MPLVDGLCSAPRTPPLRRTLRYQLIKGPWRRRRVQRPLVAGAVAIGKAVR